MIKALIVDDEYEKVQRLTMAILNLAPEAQIVHETTATSARRKLMTECFDLLIIDLHIPDNIGAPPNKEGGLALFDLLILDSNVTLPTSVLFITARSELFSEAKSQVESRGALLCRYGIADENNWESLLKGKVQLILAYRNRANLMQPKADVVIVTALQDPELDAVLKLNYQWSDKRFHDDPTRYFLGQIPNKRSKLCVVAASAHRKGMPSSSALSMKMVERFRPKYLVMLGICAGIKGKVNLGDVIVADPTWDWGSGKYAETKDGSTLFHAAPYQCPLNSHISQLAKELAFKDEVISDLRAEWKGATPSSKLAIHIGPMASGAAVLATKNVTDEITGQNREVIAVEMESYAVMAAADYSRAPKPISIAIKSVCDFADAKKSDDWQKYASYTSASFFHQLFTNAHLP